MSGRFQVALYALCAAVAGCAPGPSAQVAGAEAVAGADDVLSTQSAGAEEAEERPEWARLPSQLGESFGDGLWAHQSSLVAGAQVESTDRFVLCSVKPETRFEIETWGPQGHRCRVEGVATWRSVDELLLISEKSLLDTRRAAELSDDPGAAEPEGPVWGAPCHFRVEHHADQLKVTESWPIGCERQWCGAHAKIVGLRFDRQTEVGTHCSRLEPR